jgi:hypothetical protein
MRANPHLFRKLKRTRHDLRLTVWQNMATMTLLTDIASLRLLMSRTNLSVSYVLSVNTDLLYGNESETVASKVIRDSDKRMYLCSRIMNCVVGPLFSTSQLLHFHLHC